MRMLDNVIDINFYPTREAENSNMRNRPVGLGSMGWHDMFNELDIVFDSEDAKNIKAVVDHAIGQGIPVLPLKFSRVFDTIFEQELSIRQMMEKDALARYAYRDVAAQFDTLISYLEQNYA